MAPAAFDDYEVRASTSSVSGLLTHRKARRANRSCLPGRGLPLLLLPAVRDDLSRE
jgi:hypothetical protein